jgi:hypothetical protein
MKESNQPPAENGRCSRIAAQSKHRLPRSFSGRTPEFSFPANQNLFTAGFSIRFPLRFQNTMRLKKPAIIGFCAIRAQGEKAFSVNKYVHNIPLLN